MGHQLAVTPQEVSAPGPKNGRPAGQEVVNVPFDLSGRAAYKRDAAPGLSFRRRVEEE